MASLLDSDVAIDLFRNHPPALTWLTGLTGPPTIPGFVAMELCEGCRNANELRLIYQFLNRFSTIWPSAAAMEFALRNYASLRLSHNVSSADALIAATATEIGAALLTFNTRHFAAVPGLVIRVPYVR